MWAKNYPVYSTTNTTTPLPKLKVRPQVISSFPVERIVFDIVPMPISKKLEITLSSLSSTAPVEIKSQGPKIGESWVFDQFRFLKGMKLEEGYYKITLHNIQLPFSKKPLSHTLDKVFLGKDEALFLSRLRKPQNIPPLPTGPQKNKNLYATATTPIMPAAEFDDTFPITMKEESGEKIKTLLRAIQQLDLIYKEEVSNNRRPHKEKMKQFLKRYNQEVSFLVGTIAMNDEDNGDKTSQKILHTYAKQLGEIILWLVSNQKKSNLTDIDHAFYEKTKLLQTKITSHLSGNLSLENSTR
ncbi:MAG: hypothetical protein HQK50_17790 [Oligoflexia bacterium]|nr:hypothetical protein [Oligoflexia bacterium]